MDVFSFPSLPASQTMTGKFPDHNTMNSCAIRPGSVNHSSFHRYNSSLVKVSEIRDLAFDKLTSVLAELLGLVALTARSVGALAK